LIALGVYERNLQIRCLWLGRIGKVHASIVQDQGQQILAIGDDIQAAIVAFQDELTVDGVKTFHDPALMASEMSGLIDAVIIASNTKYHARDALPS
jgi:predicted dehydrogenase